MREIRLFERGNGINSGDQFVARVDSEEGHRRVTLVKIVTQVLPIGFKERVKQEK